jgi:hypothetical protein
VINVKLSGIAAGAGFILSFIVAIASGAGPSVSLLRGLLWAGAFFVLSGGVWALIKRFIPELLLPPREDAVTADMPDGMVAAGSRVDISLGDGDDALPVKPVLPEEDGAAGDMGNIADLLGTARSPGAAEDAPGEDSAGTGGAGMDLNEKERYTERGNGTASPAFTPDPAPPSVQNAVFGDDGLEDLPDLDTMAGAFMASGEVDDDEEPAAYAPPEGNVPPGRKDQSLGGDFDPKELASALQTILKKD